MIQIFFPFIFILAFDYLQFIWIWNSKLFHHFLTAGLLFLYFFWIDFVSGIKIFFRHISAPSFILDQNRSCIWEYNHPNFSDECSLLGHPRRGGLYRSACLCVVCLSVCLSVVIVRVRRSVGRSVGRSKDYGWLIDDWWLIDWWNLVTW